MSVLTATTFTDVAERDWCTAVVQDSRKFLSSSRLFGRRGEYASVCKILSHSAHGFRHPGHSIAAIHSRAREEQVLISLYI